MALKPFCDLCGKPAMDTGFTTLFLRRREVLNREGFHLNVEFTDAGKHYPVSTDKRADICPLCMAEGLRAIAAQLDASAQNKETDA